jgi:lipoyl synthase
MSTRRQLPTLQRKPEWLKVRPGGGAEFARTRGALRHAALHTVCEEAHCPNLGECWSMGTATLMVLGDQCTRHCRFCNVASAKHPPPVRQLGLRYVVLTMVDRDDLPDGGAAHVAACVAALRATLPELGVETLVGDFAGDEAAIDALLAEPADVLGHNVEVVERLTGKMRDRRCSYRQSLDVLAMFKRKRPDRLTKSSIMLGLGETMDELRQTLGDLRAVGVDMVTLGQYLRPSRKHAPVLEYVPPRVFAALEQEARALGFLWVASGPLVRSSYRAGELFVARRLAAQRAPADD